MVKGCVISNRAHATFVLVNPNPYSSPLFISLHSFAGEDGRADEARADGRLVPDLPALEEPRLAHVQGVHLAAHRRAQEGRVG